MTLFISLKVPSPSIITLGVRFQHMNLEGGYTIQFIKCHNKNVQVFFLFVWTEQLK